MTATRLHLAAQGVALASVLGLLSWFAGVASAQGQPAQQPWQRPLPPQAQPAKPNPPPCPVACRKCVPNVKNFGYYQPKWRHWPGENRLEQANPRGVGNEVLPTPRGQEEVPLPRATPQQQALPPQQVLPPQTPIPPADTKVPPIEEHKIIAPEGLLIPAKPAEDAYGQPTPKEESPSKQEPEQEMPGLPSLPSEPPQAPPKNKPSETPKDAPADTPKPTGRSTFRVEPAVANNVVPSDPKPAGRSSFRIEAAGNNVAPAGPIALVGGIEPERDAMLPSAHRADSIGVTPPTSSGTWIEPAAYAEAESVPAMKVEPLPTIEPEPRPTMRPTAEAVVERPMVTHEAAAEISTMPKVAIGGYCPVELLQNSRWVPGDIRWTVVHNGWICRLSGTAQRQQFLANPDRFIPVNSGNDPVASIDEHRLVPGQLAYCAVYEDRLYVFSSAATQARFNENPHRYTVVRQ